MSSMFQRLPIFRYFKSSSDRLTTQLNRKHSKQSLHCSSSFGVNNHSFATYAAFGLTVFSLSTIMYAFQSRKQKVYAAPIHTAKCPEWNWDWDGRENRTPKTKHIRSITLIRHGQYVHADSDDELILTDLGRQQAKITGQKLKSFGTNYDEIICSTMIRAKQTAEIILNELYAGEETEQCVDIKHDSNLNEGSPSQIVPEREYLNKCGFWENLETDSVRIGKAFETYIHRSDNDKDEQVLIIGHGNVFRYFVCNVLQFPVEGWLRFAICNCSITKFRIFGDGRISVECIGSDGHFTKEFVTFN